MKIKGKQMATGVSGVATANLVDGILSANAAGRAKIATGFFDFTTVSSKFLAASIPLSKLEEAVIQADGDQPFTADQSMGGFKLTDLAAPTDDDDASTKKYVDDAVSGFTWQKPASVRNFIGNNDVATINGLLPGTCDAYVMTDAGVLTLGALAVSTGDLVEYDGAAWVKIVANSGGFPPAGTRVMVSTTVPLIAPLTDGVDDGKIAEWDGTAIGPLIFGTPIDGWAILISGDGACDENSTFGFNGTVPTGSWVQTSSGVPFAGVGEITSVDGGDAADAGVSVNAARGDHQHAVSTAAAVAVGTANAEGSATTLARSDHVHDSPAPTEDDKIQTPSGATSGDEEPTGVILANTPALDSYVQVFLNGLKYTVGDAVKTENCYFSDDGGTTALAIANISAGSELIWNGAISGFDLVISDVIELDYIV